MSILGDLTLDDLRYLVAYADAKGISAAADRLGVKQPTVSKRMDLVFRRLRTEANVQHSLVRRKDDQRPAVLEVIEMIKEVAAEFQEKIRRRWHGII